MDLQLAGKLCLVTGASTGIGRATANALAAEGAQLLVTARSPEPLAKLAAAITETGGPEPIPLIADFARPDAASTLAEQALSQAGRVDVLVNNAGGSRPMLRPDDPAVWAESLALNFEAVRLLSEQLLPGMAERGWGRIVNITGSILQRDFNAAAAHKAALESWAKMTASLYAARGVTVNCVAPGRIKTAQIMDRLYPTEAARQAFIERNIPAGRFGEPEEAAALIAFLASGPASFITGVTVPVDGGTLRFAF